MANKQELRTVLSRDLGWRPITAADKRALKIPDAELRPSLSRFCGEILDGSLWLQVDLDVDWRACYRIRRNGRRVIVAEIRIVPIEHIRSTRSIERVKWPPRSGEWSGSRLGERAPSPGRGIDGTVIDRLRSRGVIRHVSNQIAELTRARPKLARVVVPEELSARSTPKRGRPKGKTVAFYRAFAARYADLEASGRVRGTRAALAREYQTNISTIARWIGKARELKLLSETKPGRRGGELLSV